MTFSDARSALADRLVTAMGEGVEGDEHFNALALEVFEHQMRWNLPYANYVRKQLGSGREMTVSHWREIPALSTDVFKYASHPIFCGDAEHAKHVFRTSGTTGEQRGAHFFHALDVYEASIAGCWRELELPELEPCFLTVAPTQWRESSLGHMMGILEEMLPCENVAGQGAHYFLKPDGELQREALLAELRNRTLNQPVLLLGTALAYLHLFEEMELTDAFSLTLPQGSMALETGGYKGTGRTLDKSALYQMFERYLGLSSHRVINEYSMTELSSQFYCGGKELHRGPSWTRARVIDPERRDDVDIGDTGYLQIVDLANIDSALAIATRDLAVNRGNGKFELIGRDPAALPRGCSRAADELIGSAAP